MRSTGQNPVGARLAAEYGHVLPSGRIAVAVDALSATTACGRDAIDLEHLARAEVLSLADRPVRSPSRRHR